jgi:hypothetical protein
MGSPTPRERHGDRATVVVGGVTTSQGVPESGAQGKGWQEEHLWSAWSWKAVKCVSPCLFSLREDVFLWKAECIERCPLGLGKDGWKRISVQSTGTGTVRFNHSRQPFWKRDNALTIYFMKPGWWVKIVPVHYLAKWPVQPVRV